MISVIIPFYNAKGYLDRCLTSVCGQTYSDLEIFLIDDGSQDESPAIAEAWKNRDSRIRVIHQPDLGVSNARNQGLDQTKGDYITFVDADDWLHPEACERLLRALEETHADVACCSFQASQGPARGCLYEPEPVGKVELVDRNGFLVDYVLSGNSRCWSILYRRSRLGDLRFEEGLSIGEDLLFLMKNAARIQSAALLSDRLYYYYVNPKGAMLRPFSPSYMDQIYCWEKAEALLKSFSPEEVNLEKGRKKILLSSYMGIFLTLGKLSGVKDREMRKRYLDICGEKLRETETKMGKDTKKALEMGYRLKGLLFHVSPMLYLRLYGMKR